MAQKPAIYDLYDEKGKYVGDFTLKELSELSGLSTSACNQRIITGGKINGCRADKVDNIVAGCSELWLEFETERKRILKLAGGKHEKNK